MPKNQPKAAIRDPSGRGDPWRVLRGRKGVRVLSVARRGPREG
jgi:hypothetical protein